MYSIMSCYNITSKTPAGRQATEGRFRDRAVERSRERCVERSSEGVFWMEYLRVSSDSNSFANRFSSSNYVDPPSLNVQLTTDTHHRMHTNRHDIKVEDTGIY